MSRSSSHHSNSSSRSHSSSTASHGSAASSASRMRDLQVARVEGRDYQGSSSTGSSTGSIHTSHSDKTVRAVSNSGRAHSESEGSRSGSVFRSVSQSGRSESQPRGRPDALGSLRNRSSSNAGRSDSGSSSGRSGYSSSSSRSLRDLTPFNNRQVARPREEDSLRAASNRDLISEGLNRGIIQAAPHLTVNIHFHGGGGGMMRIGGPGGAPRPLFSPHDGLPPRCSDHANYPDYSGCGYCRGVRAEVDRFYRGE
ncbi:hypothetical protein BDZ45DRAFT_753954 [Acephala macrosclerotiorum]|nr:hypothetical protein BDZ45DRAFT_753954 [Acephala macrosclerotiorum]